MAVLTDVLPAIGVEHLSKLQVRAICQELGAIATSFRRRELTQAYPYAWFDGLYERIRTDDSVVSNAVVTAYGISVDGHRDVIGIGVTPRSCRGVQFLDPARGSNPRRRSHTAPRDTVRGYHITLHFR